MTTSLIHSVHVQFSQCKYCTEPLHIYRIRSWRLWQNWRGNSHSHTHKSPCPRVISVLQDAAPRAFGTCLLTRMEIWTCAINFVICVSHHFKFGSGHTQEGACQRALHQFNVCAWFKFCSLDFVQSINLGKLCCYTQLHANRRLHLCRPVLCWTIRPAVVWLKTIDYREDWSPDR